MLKKSATLVLVVLIALSFTACKKDKVVSKSPSKSKKASTAIKENVLRDAKADIAIIEKVTNNPDDFSKALANKGLEAFKKDYETDLAAGKVKLRKYDDVKLKFVDVRDKLARVRFTYSDSSHYVSKDDLNSTLDFPQSEKKKLMLHLLSDGKSWKIVAVAPAD